MAESFVGQKAKDVLTTGRTAARVFSPDFAWDDREDRKPIKEAYQSVVVDHERRDATSDEEALDSVTRVIEGRKLADLSIDYSKPYWNSEGKYNPYEVFSIVIDYPDANRFMSFDSVRPPEADVKRFIEGVHEKYSAKGSALNVGDQLEVGLEVSGNNIVGAANLGFFATRVMARDLDQRVYPDIKVTPQDILKWNEEIAQFEIYGKDQKVDGPGDTYYWWTHFFGALTFKAVNNWESEAFQAGLSKGTEIMRTVRTHFAKRPTQTPHEEASVLGRQIGLAVAETLGVSERPVFSPVNE